jgi:hypothetical protein
MQSVGNINYSLNKNDYYKIMTSNCVLFLPFYYILTILSIFYTYTIRYRRYIFHYGKGKVVKDDDIPHFFKSLTFNSPFNILELSEKNKDSNKAGDKKDSYIGFSNKSYLLIIITNVIAYLFILEGIVRNFIYSVIVNIIQTNSNNNPYNNSNCVSKLNESPYQSIVQNYTAITSMGIMFLFPFIIPFLLYFLKFDNYDIKHNKWITYVILFFIFYPIIMTFLSRISFAKKLEIFPNINKFIETKDSSFVTFIQNKCNSTFFSIRIYLFIIFVFCYYTLVHLEFKISGWMKYLVYALILFILFVFIPALLLFTGLSVIYSNNYKEKVNDNATDIINDINNNNVSSIYELLVKYNYPCFYK